MGEVIDFSAYRLKRKLEKISDEELLREMQAIVERIQHRSGMGVMLMPWETRMAIPILEVCFQRAKTSQIREMSVSLYKMVTGGRIMDGVCQTCLGTGKAKDSTLLFVMKCKPCDGTGRTPPPSAPEPPSPKKAALIPIK